MLCATTSVHSSTNWWNGFVFVRVALMVYIFCALSDKSGHALISCSILALMLSERLCLWWTRFGLISLFVRLNSSF